MSEKKPKRRDFLFTATYAVGAVGVGAVVWPMVDQMNQIMSATMVDEFAGLKVKTGAVESTTQNVPEVALIVLFEASSTD